MQLTSQSSDPQTVSAAALSALTSVGGIIGYVRTGSVPSIAAGLSIGTLYLAACVRLYNRQTYGEVLGLVASVVLGGSSIPRALKTQKTIPSVLSLASAYGAVVFGLALKAKKA